MNVEQYQGMLVNIQSVSRGVDRCPCIRDIAARHPDIPF